jgi:hypothetical protein
MEANPPGLCYTQEIWEAGSIPISPSAAWQGKTMESGSCLVSLSVYGCWSELRSYLLDFGFFAWPEPGVGEYSQVRDETNIDEAARGTGLTSWHSKVQKLFWRGVPMVTVRKAGGPPYH